MPPNFEPNKREKTHYEILKLCNNIPSSKYFLQVVEASATSEKDKKGEITAVAKSGVAKIRIKGYIGGEKANSDVLTLLVDDFLSKGIKTAEVEISSQGGSVFDANDMIAELERFDTVKLKAGAVIASAATMFFVAFDDSEGRTNTQVMVHKPSGGAWGNEDDIESRLTAIRNITRDYRAKYAAKMSKTEDEIEEMWAKGDKWFTAKEAQKIGLLKVVISEKATIDEATAEMIEACGAPIKEKVTAAPEPSKPKNEPTKKIMDKEQLIAMLGLDATASDATIEAAMKEAKRKADLLDKSKNDNEAQLETEAVAAVNEAVIAKKIPASVTAHYVTMYKANPTEVKATFAELPAIPKLSGEIKPEGNLDVEAARKDWTLADYLDKDSKALTAMQDTDPERFKKLNDDYYNVGL